MLLQLGHLLFQGIHPVLRIVYFIKGFRPIFNPLGTVHNFERVLVLDLLNAFYRSVHVLVL